MKVVICGLCGCLIPAFFGITIINDTVLFLVMDTTIVLIGFYVFDKIEKIKKTKKIKKTSQ